MFSAASAGSSSGRGVPMARSLVVPRISSADWLNKVTRRSGVMVTRASPTISIRPQILLSSSSRSRHTLASSL